MKKTYLTEIKHKSGATLTISAYTDTLGKFFRVYYNGSDTGRRYERIGNAARYLEEVRGLWGVTCVSCSYGNTATIQKRGSDYNNKMFDYWYNGAPLPAWD